MGVLLVFLVFLVLRGVGSAVRVLRVLVGYCVACVIWWFWFSGFRFGLAGVIAITWCVLAVLAFSCCFGGFLVLTFLCGLV